MQKHERVEVRFGDRWEAHAEVCWQCSDPDAGAWVPVSFCTLAMVGMPQVPYMLGGEVDMDLQFYRPPNARSIWDEEPFDPMDRWDAFDPDACWRGARAA